ncbi:MAG TPA: bifunctional pyr operon transcriptional regulator/uracil phosphoribosyltransferase PyrR [Aromatoleum sp.]|uniref:bifunctional pyr operon transcriptional regulator/uracil phosphoribosyltransferase PyrR n=1 Tax=Aromatoleum sp. TaxID=2307007 RepID=UPI002B46FEC7|nr:bifunctional pyr operon transcriptional regulator/uracil phosphoribosyltransferase PyrR [Aromatoleum sp.]HJV28558.1 bifunctional pyr operon transcriptional regulator/uracil phosphoribosyltransferase PyrR [Aromatoleum sp.]
MHNLDAEALCQALIEQMRPQVGPDTALVGIHTGGVWLAQRLVAALGLKQSPGSIDVSFYRDDFGSRGLHPQPKRTEIPFDVEGAHVIIVDDVLYTGRTTRAAINELFDFGRPGRVELAVLIDRGGRELPIAPKYCALTLPAPLPANQRLELEADAAGALTLRLIDA